MFNSTDMQTAYIRGEIMVDRLQKGFNGQAGVRNIYLNVDPYL